MLVSVTIALFSIWTAYKWYYYDDKWSVPRKLVLKFKGIYKLLWNKYFVDEIYFTTIVDPLITSSREGLWKFLDVKIIDGFVNGLASITTFFGNQVRKIQTGFAQTYAIVMLAGAIILISWLFFGL